MIQILISAFLNIVNFLTHLAMPFDNHSEKTYLYKRQNIFYRYTLLDFESVFIIASILFSFTSIVALQLPIKPSSCESDDCMTL